MGRTKTEAVEYHSALADLEDAKRAAGWRQQLRKAGVDPYTGAELEVPNPSELAVEAAAALASRDESPEAVGRGVRRRWLSRSYGRME